MACWELSSSFLSYLHLRTGSVFREQWFFDSIISRFDLCELSWIRFICITNLLYKETRNLNKHIQSANININKTCVLELKEHFLVCSLQKKKEILSTYHCMTITNSRYKLIKEESSLKYIQIFFFLINNRYALNTNGKSTDITQRNKQIKHTHSLDMIDFFINGEDCQFRSRSRATNLFSSTSE